MILATTTAVIPHSSVPCPPAPLTHCLTPVTGGALPTHQAEDRAHRIGQEHSSVNVQYLLVGGSVGYGFLPPCTSLFLLLALLLLFSIPCLFCVPWIPGFSWAIRIWPAPFPSATPLLLPPHIEHLSLPRLCARRGELGTWSCAGLTEVLGSYLV